MRAGFLFFATLFSVGLYSAPPHQAETPEKQPFKFTAGQKVYIVSVESVEGATSKLDTRLDPENYQRAEKAFTKERRFDITENIHQADFVFYCLRFGKHGEKEIGLAIKPQDLERNITPINEVRWETNLDGLMAASLWNSEANEHQGRRMGIAMATGGVYQGRYKVIGELVKAFYKEVL